jgi:hypothetical protein
MLMRAITILLVLFVTYGSNTRAQAEQSNDCKCRVYLEACLKNHSRAACNTEYGICMSHCRKSSDRLKIIDHGWSSAEAPTTMSRD